MVSILIYVIINRALPGEGGAEVKKDVPISEDQSVEAILRHVMEVTW